MQESTSTVHTQRRCIQSDNRRSKLTLSNSWFGESGSVCLSTIRFPVNVYSELFGCSHCISPVRQKETQHKLHQIIKEKETISTKYCLQQELNVRLHHDLLIT